MRDSTISFFASTTLLIKLIRQKQIDLKEQCKEKEVLSSIYE
jgi:hypothetical protein